MKSVLFLIYFGTYTGGDSRGIYVADFNASSGKISNVRLAAESENPSFLHIHPNGKVLYSVTENTNEKGSSIVAWEITSDGTLKKINEQPADGDHPCFVTVSADGKLAGIANYTSGDIALYPLASDGSIGQQSEFVAHQGSSINKQRQEGPHAHSIQFDPSGEFVLAADLGIDQLLVYRLVGQKLEKVGAGNLKPGAGPRHFAFSRDGRFVFVINELDCTATTFAFSEGKLSKKGTVTTIPIPYQQGFSTAEILVHPDKEFVYGSNRGHDSIAVFKLDASKGTLTPAGHFSSGGQTPRNFRISPDGKWLLTANQDSGVVWVNEINLEKGLAKKRSQVRIPKPVCIKFLPLPAPQEK